MGEIASRVQGARGTTKRLSKFMDEKNATASKGREGLGEKYSLIGAIRFTDIKLTICE